MADAYENLSISHQEFWDSELPEGCSDPRFFNFNVHKLHNNSLNHTLSEFQDLYKANKQQRNHHLPPPSVLLHYRRTLVFVPVML